jgi:hypothetical protein
MSKSPWRVISVTNAWQRSRWFWTKSVLHSARALLGQRARLVHALRAGRSGRDAAASGEVALVEDVQDAEWKRCSSGVTGSIRRSRTTTRAGASRSLLKNSLRYAPTSRDGLARARRIQADQRARKCPPRAARSDRSGDSREAQKYPDSTAVERRKSRKTS